MAGKSKTEGEGYERSKPAQDDEARDRERLRDQAGMSTVQQRDDDERRDRERLRAEAVAVTPERLSELMTEKANLKTDYAAHRKAEDEAYQRRIHELEVEIAKGQPYNPGRTV